ncbi:MAG: SMP-30/gluconolactonase/LRE family protein [Proteobacteria bacterium]|nr:SMP-30/gluconolactonase/LRE family protein [Cystobacterineae bacterium]MCL2258909.1 SMP-30/gluconolactonase/LRE family protein [Cystobacterineae bacterium]MCL2314737.1 SMP-30/gluconolactonase/LRE family protein [Pseudomonadota bacterium]
MKAWKLWGLYTFLAIGVACSGVLSGVDCVPACMGGDVCVHGRCQAAEPVECVDNDECVVLGAVCIKGLCQVPNSAECVFACMEGEACVGGECQVTGPAGCVDSDECVVVCVDGVCQTMRLVVRPESLVFDLSAGTKTLQVSSNATWSASCTSLGDWCSVTPSAGSGNAVVTVSVLGNERNEARRSADVVIETTDGKLKGTVNIGQIGNEPLIHYFNPSAAPHGVTLTVYGQNFSPVLSNNRVTLNGVEARILSASSDVISVEVPKNKACTGFLQVSVSGRIAKFLDEPYEFAYVLTAAARTIADISASGIAINAAGNLYVTSGNRIREVALDGVVTTIAGSDAAGLVNNSVGTRAQFSAPQGIAIDATGNLYVADFDNHCIRMVAPTGSRAVSTFAGECGVSGFVNGERNAARFNRPRGLAIDARGNLLYVADSGNNRIRRIVLNGAVTTLRDNNGNIEFDYADGPDGIAIGAEGKLYVTGVAENVVLGNRIYEVSLQGESSGVVSSFPMRSYYNSRSSIALGTAGSLYVADARIHKIGPQREQSSFLPTFSEDEEGYYSGIEGIAIDANGNLYVADSYINRLYQVTVWEE